MTEVLVIIVIPVLLFIAYSYIRDRKERINLRKLNNKRKRLTRNEYIQMLRRKGYDKQHIEVVYDELSDYIGISQFSLYPEDDIHKLYGVADLDDVELIDKICKKLNLKMPSQEDLDILNNEFDITSAEYILTLTRNLSK